MYFDNLIGRRILVVEDDYLQAREVTLAMESQGSDVVGPFPNLQDGLAATDYGTIDAAILDIRLGDGTVYALADRLMQRDVPFMFITGYDRRAIPARFDTIRVLEKPFQLNEVEVALALAIAEQARRH